MLPPSASRLVPAGPPAAAGGLDFEQMIERMPENAPPKWIFRNITTIRENTERILALLESERTPAPGERAPTAA